MHGQQNKKLFLWYFRPLHLFFNVSLRHLRFQNGNRQLRSVKFRRMSKTSRAPLTAKAPHIFPTTVL